MDPSHGVSRLVSGVATLAHVRLLSGATGAARQWLHQRNGEEPQELDKQILGASIRVNSASGPRAAETSSYRDALRSRARLNGRSATLTRKFKFDQLGSLT